MMQARQAQNRRVTKTRIDVIAINRAAVPLGRGKEKTSGSGQKLRRVNDPAIWRFAIPTWDLS